MSGGGELAKSELPRKLEIAGSILLAEVTNEARIAVAQQAGTKRLAWSAVSNCCPFCSYMDGKVILADDPRAERLIPAHIHCECCWSPIGDDEQGRSEERLVGKDGRS